jgi:hypothetical protein
MIDEDGGRAKQGKQAAAFYNGDFFCVETESGHGLLRPDPEGAQHLLPADASDESLGAAVLDALRRSRFLPVEEARAFLNHKKGQDDHDARTAALMKRYGYRTKRFLFRNMMQCGIEEIGDSITVSPTCHDRLEEWGRKVSDEFEDVVIPANSHAVEVGTALRLGFTRCR